MKDLNFMRLTKITGLLGFNKGEKFKLYTKKGLQPDTPFDDDTKVIYQIPIGHVYWNEQLN
jgi:hypothetical protein